MWKHFLFLLLLQYFDGFVSGSSINKGDSSDYGFRYFTIQQQNRISLNQQQKHIPQRRFNLKTHYDPTTHKNWRLVNDDICGENEEDRIIGGDTAKLGQFPWMAKIGFKGRGGKISFKCGGTLINSFYVLTAGHCLQNVIGVRLGEYRTSEKVDCVNNICADEPKNFIPAKVVVHESFNTPPQNNDIGLIRLDKEVQFTRWIRPICLPYGPLLHKSYLGSMMDVAGWGLYDLEFWNASDVLNVLKVPVRDTEVCVKSYPRQHISHQTQLCVGGTVGQDSCQGDSGGPLMKVDQVDSPKYFIFGIVSIGPTYCGSNHPAIYTKVQAYLKWILDHISD